MSVESVDSSLNLLRHAYHHLPPSTDYEKDDSGVNTTNSMIQRKQQIPLAFRQPFPNVEHIPPPSPLVDTVNVHFYVLRLHGVRCERHVGIMTMSELPAKEELPPIFIFPNGISQRQVEYEKGATLKLTYKELQLCQLFHLYAFNLISDPPTGLPSSSSASSSYIADSPTWHTAAEDSPSSQFVFVACTHKSACELELQHELPHVDEHEELILDEEIIRARLLEQAAQRAALLNGAYHSTEKPLSSSSSSSSSTSSTATSSSSSTPPSSSLALDLSYMRCFVRHYLIESSTDFGSRFGSTQFIRFFLAQIAVLGSTKLLHQLETEFESEFNTSFQSCTGLTLYDWFRSHRRYFHVNEVVTPSSTRCIFIRRIDSIEVDLMLEGGRKDDSIDTPILLQHPRCHVLETRYNQRLYLNLGLPTNQNALSRFPNPAYTTYESYYRQRWPNVVINNPMAPLITAVKLQLTPRNVLFHQLLTDKKRHQHEPIMYLLPDSITQWKHCTAELLQVIRMVPSIMYRLETYLLQHEFAHSYLYIPINPVALAQSFTTSNAQEIYALQPMARADSTSHLAKQCKTLPLTMVHSLDRLKFVGDSIMKWIISKCLLASYSDDDVQSLTDRKGSLLSATRLANCAIQAGLQHIVIANPFQVNIWKPPGRKGNHNQTLRAPSSLSTSSPSTRSARHSDYGSISVSQSVLADVVSSVVGAAWYSQYSQVTCIGVMIGLKLVDGEMIDNILGEYCFFQYTSIRTLIDLSKTMLETIHQRIASQFIIPEACLIQPTSDRLTMIRSCIPNFQSMIDYQFHHPLLLIQSFTHSSWSHRDRHQIDRTLSSKPLPAFDRLELLGDAVIDVCTSTFLVDSFPWCYCASSGELSFMRQRFVNNDLFGRVMIDQGMEQLILHTADQIDRTIETIRSSEVHSTPASFHTSSIKYPKILADSFESVIGAIYVDDQFTLEPAWNVFKRLIHFDVEWEDQIQLKVYGGRARQPEAEVLPLPRATQSDLIHPSRFTELLLPSFASMSLFDCP